jgi:hypothetical protein
MLVSKDRQQRWIASGALDLASAVRAGDRAGSESQIRFTSVADFENCATRFDITLCRDIPVVE